MSHLIPAQTEPDVLNLYEANGGRISVFLSQQAFNAAAGSAMPYSAAPNAAVDVTKGHPVFMYQTSAGNTYLGLGINWPSLPGHELTIDDSVLHLDTGEILPRARPVPYDLNDLAQEADAHYGAMGVILSPYLQKFGSVRSVFDPSLLEQNCRPLTRSIPPMSMDERSAREEAYHDEICSEIERAGTDTVALRQIVRVYGTDAVTHIVYMENKEQAATILNDPALALDIVTVAPRHFSSLSSSLQANPRVIFTALAQLDHANAYEIEKVLEDPLDRQDLGLLGMVVTEYPWLYSRGYTYGFPSATRLRDFLADYAAAFGDHVMAQQPLYARHVFGFLVEAGRCTTEDVAEKGRAERLYLQGIRGVPAADFDQKGAPYLGGVHQCTTAGRDEILRTLTSEPYRQRPRYTIFDALRQPV